MVIKVFIMGTGPVGVVIIYNISLKIKVWSNLHGRVGL